MNEELRRLADERGSGGARPLEDLVTAPLWRIAATLRATSPDEVRRDPEQGVALLKLVFTEFARLINELLPYIRQHFGEEPFQAMALAYAWEAIERVDHLRGSPWN